MKRRRGFAMGVGRGQPAVLGFFFAHKSAGSCVSGRPSSSLRIFRERGERLLKPKFTRIVTAFRQSYSSRVHLRLIHPSHALACRPNVDLWWLAALRLMVLWFALCRTGTVTLAADFTPTEEEAAFLREHPVWRMAGAPSPPFQWTDANGDFQGIAQDYREIIQKALGIQVQPIPAPTWGASLEQMRHQECDISLLTADTPARREFLLFTDELLRLPVAVIAHKVHSPITGIKSLAGQRVAVPRGWPIQERLQNDCPQIILVPRDDVASAVTSVALGDADAYVGDLASATDAIDRLGIRNLKVVGETSYVFPFRIAVRKDWPDAVALLNKVIDSIPPEEHARIRGRWILGNNSGWPLNRILMFGIPGAIGLVTLTLLIVNQRLSREIAQRKKTEAALRESEERWSFALEGSRDGVWDWDVAKNKVFFSKRFQSMLEISDNEMEAGFQAWTSRVHPDDLDAVLEAMQRHLRGETPDYATEHRVQAKDGRFWWILSRGRVVSREKSGKPLRMVGTHTDITEQKRTRLARQAELEETVRTRTEELARAERELRQITDNIPGAVYQFVKKVDESFAFTFCSVGMEAMVGVRCEDILRDVNTVWAVIHPIDLKVLVEKANHSAATHTEYCQDLRIIHPDGRSWWIQAEAAPQRQPDGSTLWNGSIMDITERKRLEEELAESKRVADSANQAKSAFLANMSHEIRTPMNAILGFSQLLMRDPALTSSQRVHLDTIARSGEHLLALINDILEISKIEAGRVALQITSFDLHALVDEVSGLFRTRAEAKGLRFTIDRDSSVPQFLRADPGKLRQVLINLIGNAVKFTERGEVILRLLAEPTSGRRVRILGEVEDTGPGIDRADLPNLFRQFEQTETGRRSGVGTGLGLAISREFIRLMGGDIFVSSEPGRGSTFRFDLLSELGDRSAREKPERRRVLRLLPSHLGMRVLIADDKLENRDLLEQILRPAGFDTLTVEDGARAVELFSEWHPKIALFDLRMPGIDGFEAIRKIRSLPNESRTPIIAVTASAFEENRRDVIAAGGDDFLGKPFRESDLFEKIARLTGAEYEYEPEPEKDEKEPVGATLTREQVLAVIPEELRARIAQATLRADFDEMLATIVEVSAHSPEIGDELRRKVESFEYQALIDLLQEESLPA